MVQYIEIKGIGKVEVDVAPTEVPNHVWVGTKKTKIPKNLYLYLWANIHATSDGRRKLDKIIV